MNRFSLTKKYKADLMLMLITTFWAAACLLMKIGLYDLEPFNLIALRFFIASLLAGLLFYKQIRQADARVIKIAFSLAIIQFAAFVTVAFGIQNTSVSNAGFLTTISVVFVPIIMALWFKQRPEGRILLSILLTLIGIALLTINEGLSANFGDLFCVLSSLLYAVYIILIDRYTADNSAIALAAIQFPVVALFSLLFSVIFETTKLPTTFDSWVIVLTLGLVCTAAALIIQTVFQRDTTPVHAGLIFSTQPLFTVVLAGLFMGESLSAQGYLGAAILLIGVFTAEGGDRLSAEQAVGQDHR